MRKLWHFILDCLVALERDDRPQARDDKQRRWLSYLYPGKF